jgi:transmembrane sensor
MQENIPTHLIVRYLSNEATAEEKKKLLDWVAEDASHHKVFLEWLTLWENKTPRLAEPDLSHALRQLNNKIDIYEEEEKKTRTLFSWRKLAASIAVFLVAGIAIYLLSKPHRPENKSV